MTSVKPTNFAHPAEEEFACILNFYGIEWQYEPRTFPLKVDTNGKVLEAFAPDFYLPAQNLYVEITTIRPELGTRKNRKLRLLKEQYPEVNIKLFKRREVRDLLRKYGLENQATYLAGNSK